MNQSWDGISKAATPQEFRVAIVSELHLRACQERMVSGIGRTTKATRDAYEHTAQAMETLAKQLEEAWPVQIMDATKPFPTERYMG